MIHYYQQPWELDDNQCALINKAYDDRLLEPFVKERNLFRLSFENRNGKWYNPEVPCHRAVGEDATIARVCFADTIEGCFRAMPGCAKFIDGGMYKWPLVSHAHAYVHVPIFDDDLMEAMQSGLIAYPHNQLVPDTYMTQEVWIMNRVQVECVAEIHIWYDATGIPNYTSAEELPVRMELINCAVGDRGWILDSLFDHPDYTLPMYENENRNFNYDI